MVLSAYILPIGFFIFLAFGIQLLFIKYGNTFLNKLLGIVLISRACQLIFYLLVDSGNLIHVPFLVKGFNLLFFVTPACLYLYLKGFMKDESSFKKWEWLHFLPLLFAIADMVDWYAMPFQMQQAAITELILNKAFSSTGKTGIVPYPIYIAIKMLLRTTYIFFSWRIALQVGFFKKTNSDLTAKKWILFVLTSASVIQVSILIFFFAESLLGLLQFDTQLLNQFYNFIAFLTLVMLLFLFYNPRVLFGYVLIANEKAGLKKIKTNEEACDGDSVVLVADKKQIKKTTAVVILKNEQVYLQRINDFMNNEKPFLDPSFNITMLSQKIDIPTHHCSYLINDKLKTSFRDWINSYRIDYFIAHYPTKSKSNTILAIALDCGFNNKVTFYNAFKKINDGVCPSNYFK